MKKKSWLCALTLFFMSTTYSLYAETLLVSFVDNRSGTMILVIQGESVQIATNTLHYFLESTDWKTSRNFLLPPKLGLFFVEKHISTTKENLGLIKDWQAVRTVYATVDQENLATVIKLIKRNNGIIVECDIQSL